MKKFPTHQRLEHEEPHAVTGIAEIKSADVEEGTLQLLKEV